MHFAKAEKEPAIDIPVSLCALSVSFAPFASKIFGFLLSFFFAVSLTYSRTFATA
jgi:hypothetical protein